MKYRTTAKAVRNGYGTVYSIGYCDMQALLRYSEPVAYTCGVYGWNADIYDFGNVAICTGYRPFGNVSTDYNTTSKYEKLAEEIIRNIYSWEERKNALRALIENFIEEVITK